jgi:hypothetical protein
MTWGEILLTCVNASCASLSVLFAILTIVDRPRD